ncbi:helix-turn-helix domain-containing protein [Massiliimalia massiliensis]|uniref:helix-turn-helix domain-containing protein n=1 Tax=Massiliimalia massiliensis TaxID=1852384 RepID=UPI000987AC08|nr:helix-turn-helix transcriptional regulator [Massiliimalia massiliensis]
MKIKEAIVVRIQELCKQQDMKYNQLATRAGVTPSTVYSMMDPSRKDLSVITLKKLLDGLEINMIDFFNCDLFRNLEQEIE